MKKVVIVHQKYGLFAGAEQFVLESSRGLKKYFDLSFCFEEKTGNGEKFFDEVFQTSSNHIEDLECDAIFVHKCLSLNLFEKIIELNKPVIHFVHDHEGYCIKGSKTFPLSQTVCPYKAGFCCYFPGLAFISKNEKGNLQFNVPKASQKIKLTLLDKQSDFFVVPSNYMKKTLQIQGYDPQKIHVLFGVRPPKELHHEEKENRIVFTGQLIRGKGLDYLIKALSKVSIPCQLDVFGTGHEEQLCKALAKRLGLEKSVHFHGFVTREQMLPTLAKATACVVPSVWAEPIATVGVEMMQLGLPVIAFDNGGIRDWCLDGMNGFLVTPKDCDQLAKKIDLLLLNKLHAKKLGENAKNYCLKKYDYENFIQRLVELFQGAMK